MTEPRSVVLGGRTFGVPALPLRLNMRAYPLCRDLTNGGLIKRVAEAQGSLDCSAEEMADLAELAFIAAQAAEPTLDRAAFDELPITPPELLDAFFIIRYQTGGWIVVAPPAEGQVDTGEAQGA